MDSNTASIGDMNMFYLSEGSGPEAVILIHGFAETSHVWKRVIPALAGKFRVIAPDLPGFGDSDIPKDGLDMTAASVRIHKLVKSLGIQKARVVGHDFGVMVGYAYAAQFPTETEKLVLMEAPLPGIAGFERLTMDLLGIFDLLVQLLRSLWKEGSEYTLSIFGMISPLTVHVSIAEEDRKIYTEKYSRPGRMHAAWQYYAGFLQPAKSSQSLQRQN